MITELIKRHEGLKLKPYKDSRGYLTIGYGRCLDTKGISEDEAEILLKNDIGECRYNLEHNLSFFAALNDVRQGVLMDMCFNLGIAGLLKFKNMLAAIERGEYDRAAAEMLDSTWADQVHDRAKELASLMKYGG